MLGGQPPTLSSDRQRRGRVQQVERSQTPQRLVEACVEVLERGGEAAVRVDEICAATSIAKPSLYHHFGDREGLIIAAQATRYRDAILYGLEAAVASASACSSREEYVELILGPLAYPADRGSIERRAVRVEVMGSALTKPALAEDLRNLNHEAAKTAVALIELGQSRGWVRPAIDVEATATWWLGALLGRHLVDDERDADLAVRYNDLVRAMLRGLLFGSPD